MKLSIVVTLLLLIISTGIRAQDETLLNQKLSFEINNQRVEAVLRELEMQSGVKFTYSSKTIDIERVISLKIVSSRLSDILRDIFPDPALQFKVVGGQIAIYKNRNTPKKSDSQSVIHQTVRGEVRDQVTNQPLIGVNVILEGSDPLLGASTDENGQFKIVNVPLGRSTFIASYLGYKSRSVPNISVDAGKELVLNLALEESSQSLKQVVIKADIDKSKPLNEMSMVSAKSFTVEETSLYAGSFNDPARMATSYAGVASGQDDSENQIIIRGNSPRGLLWRLEGIEIPNPNHFADDGGSSGAISLLNSNVLTNSDFITGAFAAEYGNAFSGVFDLKLRNGNNEKREYSLKAGLLGLDASIEGPIRNKNKKNIPDASYLLNYRFSTTSILNAIGLAFDDGINDPAFQDLAFKLHIPTNRLGVFSLWGLGGLSHQLDTNVLIQDNELFKLMEEDVYNVGIVGISHDYSLSNDSYLETRLSYSSTKYGFYFENVANKNIFVEDDEQYTNNAMRISSTYHQKFNARHNTKIGFTYSRLGYDLSSQGLLLDTLVVYEVDERGGTDMWQGFVSHKFDLNDNLTLTGGIHYIRLNLAGQQNIEPRFGLNWQFAKRQSLSFGFGVHSRREETSLYFTKLLLPDSVIRQPNTNLDLAKARHFVIGYDQIVGKDFHLRLEAYYQSLYDIPVATYPNTLYSTINVENAYIRTPLDNEGTGRNYGVELTFEKFLSGGYYFLFTGALFRSLYEVEGREFSSQYDGKYNTGLVAGKEFPMQGRSSRVLSVGFEGVFTGGKRIYPVDLIASSEAGETIYDVTKPFDRQLPDYSRVDFQIALKTQKAKSTHELKLDVQNLTSRQNVFYEHYSSEQQAIAPLGYLGQIIPVLSYKVVF